MKVYITNANAKRIISNLNHNYYIDDDNPIVKNFKWLNMRERNVLNSYFWLFYKPEQLLKKFKNKPKTETFVFDSKPSYHRYSDCKMLNSSFNNFKIPEYILQQGRTKIDKFKSFFEDNKSLIENDFNFFKDKLRWAFGEESIPENVNYENSGNIEYNNLNLTEIKAEIIQIIKGTNEFLNNSESNKVIINNFGQNAHIAKKKLLPKNNFTEYSNENIWETLSVFDKKFKEPYKKNTIEFFRLLNNPELKFENNILDKLGLSSCKSCENTFINKNLNDNQRDQNFG